jgi:hypothetical protein
MENLTKPAVVPEVQGKTFQQIVREEVAKENLRREMIPESISAQQVAENSRKYWTPQTAEED